MQLISVQNDVESLENRGEMQLLLQLMALQLQIPWERSSCGCSSLQRKRSSFAAHFSFHGKRVVVDVEGRGDDDRGAIPTKPI